MEIYIDDPRFFFGRSIDFNKLQEVMGSLDIIKKKSYPIHVKQVSCTRKKFSIKADFARYMSDFVFIHRDKKKNLYNQN
jgi:hypothetical protein